MDDIITKLLLLLDQLVEERGVPKNDQIVDKNIIKSPNSPFNKGNIVSATLKPNEKRRLEETFKVFNKSFFEFQEKKKKDTSAKTLISQIKSKSGDKTHTTGSSTQKQTTMPQWLKLLLGVGAFAYGLMNDGPLKGTMKIISKIGIGGAIKSIVKSLKFIYNVISSPLEKIFGHLKEGESLLSKLGSLKTFKHLKKLSSGKLLGGFLKFIKPLAKIVRRIPIIGNIINIAFAISRFRSGDITGGVIDILSGLSGLLYFVAPPVALAMSTGLDVLNAWLDYKQSTYKDKKVSKLDILKEMMSPITNRLKTMLPYIPVIGGFRYFGDSVSNFRNGNIKEGIQSLGKGIIGFVGGKGLVDGIGILLSMFTDKQPESPNIPSSNWLERIKQWIKNKLKNLPEWITTPLKWFGIIEKGKESDNVGDLVFDKMKDPSSEIAKYVQNIWKKFKLSVSDTVTKI